MTKYEYTYDQRGDIIRTTGSDGSVLEQSYDAQHNKVSETEDGVTLRWSHLYDFHGNLVQTTNPDGTTRSFTYDDRDMLVSETASDGGTKIFLYDDQDNMVLVCGPTLGDICWWENDEWGRSVSVTMNDGMIINIYEDEEYR